MTSGSVVIVTGGSQGIGLAVARDLATRGMRVVIADLVNAQRSARSLQDLGLAVCGYDVDVSDPDQVEALVAYTLEEYGAIDALVNNAGIYSSLVPTGFESLTAEDWRRVLDVNVLGLFLCCKAVIPAFRQAGQGSIVNISSGVAFKGNPLMAHYVASKGAVISLTRALATECGEHRVRVNSVAPGFTLSDGVKGPSLKGRVLSRDMTAEDLVGAVAFFVGNESAFITGQTLVVDGGAYFH
ncbi:SDR family NAD(P)-dependent oxidoreductase [Marinobacter shengliensis]|jgi:NAD(P)-dependent dehydrogenase (short-subunit alcohol dehydrogenase family)|uniref:SDR family NAD(P)-dependent oxidoreductase n=1 Tax=Marinobacter shengliensis TaxID=1389223 RepID=UPI0025723032|nr:SDR family NAD(P)-dependent oxidoreductase [Marinobacter shengliensis]BEH13067.1 3-oxoacyl-ACP reductase [Marinobacter shengliensis]